MSEQSSIKFRDRVVSFPIDAPFSYACLACSLLITVNIRGLGTAWAALMVLLAVTILFLSRKGLPSLVMKTPILVLLPCFFVLSCGWSDQHFISLSLGLQSLLTVLASVAIAYRLSQCQLLAVIFVAVGIVCIVCIGSGRMGASAEGAVLVGFTGSKDAMGLLAYAGVMSSMAVLFDRNQRRSLRIGALVIGVIECGVAVSVHAATAVVALGLGIVLFLTILLIFSQSKVSRWAGYFVFLGVLLSVVLFQDYILDLFQSIIHQGLGKDSTLTGRTILWQKAIDLWRESPIFGHGYRSFWVGGTPDARMQLWQQGVIDGRGFHFHEQYLEVLADMGAIGEVFLLLTLGAFAVKMWKNAIACPSAFTSYSMATLMVLLIRLFFETNFLPFSFDMMLLFALGTASMKRVPKDCAGGNGFSLKRCGVKAFS